MTTDPSTGLPELPEGLFWSVRYVPMMEWYELQLREKLLIGSRKLGWWAMRPREFNQRKILEWAEHAMRNPEDIGKGYQANRGRTDHFTERQLLGDYPPKKLGNLNAAQEK